MRRTIILGLAMTLVGCGSTPGEHEDQQETSHDRATLVIADITLVDGRSGLKQPGVTVVLEGDRILTIGVLPDTLPPELCAGPT